MSFRDNQGKIPATADELALYAEKALTETPMRFHFSQTSGWAEDRWCCTRDDYDGPGSPLGLGPTREAAKADLLEKIAERER